MRKKHVMSLLWAILILYAGVFFVDHLASKGTTFHFGKDNGLVFRLFLLCVCSALFFFITRQKVRYLFIGLFIGLGAFIIALIFMYFISNGLLQTSIKNPLIYVQIIAATLVFIFEMLYLRKRSNT